MLDRMVSEESDLESDEYIEHSTATELLVMLIVSRMSLITILKRMTIVMRCFFKQEPRLSLKQPGQVELSIQTSQMMKKRMTRLSGS